MIAFVLVVIACALGALALLCAAATMRLAMTAQVRPADLGALLAFVCLFAALAIAFVAGGVV